MRDLVFFPSVEEFTQGSIFNGLKIDRSGLSAAAVVITARCDIANNKARNILCLPIYRATDWLLNQGDELIFRRVEERLWNKIGNELVRYDISIDVVDTYPIDTIFDKVQENAKGKDVTEVRKLLDMYAQKKCDYSLKFVEDGRSSLVSALIKNSENSVYFIEQIYNNEALEPYVIDLTEPISIPLPVAEKLKRGINKKNCNEEDAVYVAVEKGDASYVSILKSPYIEQLLQKFSSFYSRIGTEDIGKDAYNYLKGKLNEI